MSTVKKNLFYNLLLLFSNLLFPVVSFAYASRILGPAGIGKVQFVISFATYFVMFAQLGIPVYGMREVAKAKGDKEKLSKLFSELLFIHFISSLMLLLTYLGVVLSLSWFHASFNYYLIGGLLVLSGFSVLDWFYMGMEEFRFLSLRSIVIKTIALMVLFLFVRSQQDLMVYFLIAIFSILANNVWNLIHLRGQVSLSFHNLKPGIHFKALFTLFISSLTISVYTLGDILLLGFMTDNKAVGFYTAAKKLTLIIIPLITSLGTVLIPAITKNMDMKDRGALDKQIDQSFAFISLFGIPVSVGLFVFAPEIMLAFSGAQFEGAVLTLRLLSPVIFLVGLGHLFGMQLLIPGGFEKQYLWATMVGMGISLILNIILIKMFKDKGAAMALLAAEAAVSFSAYYFVGKKMKIRLNWALAVKAFLASLLFIPVALWFHGIQISLFIGLTIAVLISALLYLAAQLFIFKETLLKSLLTSFISSIREQG